MKLKLSVSEFLRRSLDRLEGKQTKRNPFSKRRKKYIDRFKYRFKYTHTKKKI